jgi:hypothetical protein
MFHALIQTYADAMYVATTLRPPASAPAREREHLADGEKRDGAPSGPLSGGVAGWLQARLARRFAATTAPALRPLPKI